MISRIFCVGLALLISASLSARAEMPFPKPAVNDRLAAHLDKFAQPRLRKITDRVYWAQYYDYSSFGFLIGNKGVIAIDCGWWPGASARALKDLRKITTKPVTHIVYTHGHADHIAGCPGLAEEANQEIEVIAHADYLRYRNEVVSSRLPFIQRRATDQMGFLLERSTAGSVGAGVGPGFYDGKAGYRPPTKLVKGGDELRIDGHTLTFIEAKADIDDAIGIYLKKDKILFPGDAVHGTGPVIASPRQEKGRDPMNWMESLERLSRLDVNILLPGHGPIYMDAKSSRRMMEDVRDTIQYIVDHIVRGLNANMMREDIIASLELPPHLKNHPDLGWYYHSLSFVARGVHSNFAGWWGDDYVGMFETPPDDLAQDYVTALGGLNATLDKADRAGATGDCAFAGRLLAHALRVAPDNERAKRLMVKCLRDVAYAAEGTSQRNYMLAMAAQINGNYDRSQARPFVGVGQLLGQVPIENLLSTLTPRLRADETLNMNERLGLRVHGTGELFTLNIRRGVLRIAEGLDTADMPVMTAPRAALIGFATQRIAFDRAIDEGMVEVADKEKAKAFFAFLD